MDGESSSPEGGPDTPPNTPVTPSHKTSKEHYKQWKDLGKCEPEPAACLGQHHHQRHHNHHNHNHNHHHQHNHHDNHQHHQQHQHQHHHHNHEQQHSHKHQSHPPPPLPDAEKKSSNSPQGICDARSSNDPLSGYSCYHAHWCAASTSSTPIPSPTPTSPSLSLSSNCSSEGETRWQQTTRLRSTQNVERSNSNRKSHGNINNSNDDDDEDNDVDQDNDQDQDQDHSGNLPNPGDLPSYITRFQWDMAKYPIKQSLRNIADIISKQVGQIDADLKTKSTTYNNLKGSLQNLEKKQTGSLLTRNLADLVKKEHFILDSEYLTTLLVIVPRTSFHDWHGGYEKLTDMIVPRSTQLITQDSEYGLFTVTLFKKVIDEFKLHAREKKFIVRDFTYNEEELAAGKNEITKLVTDKKKQFGPLVRWLRVNFSECFCAWIHVKALRVFVESVLRYGLPVNFQAILLLPRKKCARRLRDVLNQLYAHLDSSATGSSAAQANQDSVDIPGLGFGQSDYYPYVYYKINVDMVDSKV